jgi:hypothetical protein
MQIRNHEPSAATTFVANTIEQQPRPVTEASQPRPPSPRSIVCAGLFAAVLLAVFLTLGASVAQAQVTASNITSPAETKFFESRPKEEPTFTIAGTTVGSGNVDIRCYAGSSFVTFVKDVQVVDEGESGTFSEEYTLPINERITDGTCTLRAVPTESEPHLNPDPFTGPRLGLGEFYTLAAGSKIYDFFGASGQLAGYGDYRSFSAGGLYDGRAINSSTFASGPNLFYGNDAYAALTANGQQHSDVQVDGVNAYGSAAAESIEGSSEFSGFPVLNVSQNYDPSNGNLMIDEEEPLVKCEPDPTIYPPTSASCKSFASTGVELTRTIVQDHNGRQATISDTYESTDGLAHEVNLVSVEDAEEAEAGYEFPWVGGGYSTHQVGERIESHPPAPASVFVNYNNALEDGSEGGGQGAITFSTPPDRFEFGEAGILAESAEFPAKRHLMAEFTRTVPARGRSLKLTQIFSWAFKQADAHTMASEAEAAIRPKVAIMSPASGMTVGQASMPVSGTVTAGGNGMPEAVDINGVTVPVADNGGWSATVALNAGENTITASTTDPGGIGASAQIAIAYQPPVTSLPTQPALAASPSPPAPPGPPAKAAATIAKSGFNAKYVWLRLACQLELPCTGKASDTAKLKVTIKSKKGAHPVTRIEHMTVASGNFSISAGNTATIKLKMTNSAKALVARLGKLFTTVRVTLDQPGNSHTPVTAFLIIRKPPAKHNRH